MQHDHDSHPALPMAAIFDGQTPTLPHYGGVELVLDEATLHIMDADLMQLPAIMHNVTDAVARLGDTVEGTAAYCRVMECHAAFMTFYTPTLKNYELPRFWLAALETALIWEVG